MDQSISSREKVDMPHKISCPNDLTALDDLMQKHCNQVSDRIELIRRIVSWNNPHLPGEEGKENKRLLHNFLNTLIKYFIRLGDSLSSCVSEDHLSDLWQELDALTGFIFQIVQDLQQNCIPLFSRTVKIIHDQNQKAYRDYQQGEQSSAFLSLGKLFFFQLIAHVFSTTDLHNPMVDVSILILSQQITQCPVKTPQELYLGLITCNMLLSSFNSIESKKLMPEVISFLTSAVACLLPRLDSYFSEDDPSSLRNNLYYHRDFYRHYKHYLLNNIKYSSFVTSRRVLSEDILSEEEELPSCQIDWSLLSAERQSEGKLLKESLLMVYNLIDQGVLSLWRDFQAFPELARPLLTIMQQLCPHQPPKLSQSLQKLHCDSLERLKTIVEEKENQRQPLQWRVKQLQQIESKTPKYHLNYILKRDRAEYDSNDKERMQLKQLNRQLKREQKAAMRELRRDASFIEEERYKERRENLEQQRQERQKNFQWLEDQQATINQQVKKGKGLMKGGGSFVAKRAAVRR